MGQLGIQELIIGQRRVGQADLMERSAFLTDGLAHGQSGIMD